MAPSSMELQDTPAATPRTEQSPERENFSEFLPSGQEFSLPPADGGKDAWLFLAAAFTMEALTWGFPFAFGVFQAYYTTHEPFAGSSQIAVIGACAMGIMYLNLPPLIGLVRMYPQYGRWFSAIGVLVMCAALAASSFSQSVPHLIATQGVLYAIGGSISYTPCILYMDEWFIKRKGVAYGIMWSGTGLAGFILPLVLEFLLGKYGFRTTLRVWSVALFLLTIPFAFFIKPRLPPTATKHLKAFKLDFMMSRTFMLHQGANVAQALGFFLPGIYLPSYARTIGASAFSSALTVLLLNVGSVFGCIIMGSLIDRFHVTSCLTLSTVGSAVATLLLWGFATNMPLLYVYCILYGIFAGSYTTTYSGVTRHITSWRNRSDEARLTGGGGTTFDPAMVIGVLSAGRGVGNIVSGPLSEALVKGMPWQGQALGGYGTGYGPLIIVTGSTALIGGTTFLWRRIGWM